MRNPSKTLQNSIFEPLYSPQEELHFQPNKPTLSASSDWLPQSHSSAGPPPIKASMKRASATIFNAHLSEEDSSSDKANDRVVREQERPTPSDHAILGMHSPPGSSSVMPTSTPSRSRSSSAVIDYDDGSVASRLLSSSITKSISSPSLLAYCKESARETPYQKTLRLRKMKLQHCAEELGSESSDGSLCGADYNNIFDGLSRIESSSQPTTREFSETYQKSEGNVSSSMMISVRSFPNLGCASFGSKHTSHIKEKSFPPPLSDTLPRTNSFSYSLRAYREDGRFVLKEVKVPCRQYFQASRKDGCLTLQCLATVEDFESKFNDETRKECSDLQELDNVSMYQVTGDVVPERAEGTSCGKIEVEYADTANLAGELEVCRLKESKKNDHVGMDNSDEKDGCLYAKSLLMQATLSNGNCSRSKNDKVNFIPHVGASSKVKSDFKAVERKKSGKASRGRLSIQHLILSSSWKQSSRIHLSGKSPTLELSIDGINLPQCAENLGLQPRSTREGSTGGEETLQEFEITSASLQNSGHGATNSASSTSTIILKDVSAKCLMENMTKLVASFGLDGAKCSCGVKSRVLENNSYNQEIESINIGVRKIENGSQKFINGVSFDVKCERKFHCAGLFKEGERDEDIVARSSSFLLDLQLFSSNSNQAALQGKEWLHSLHCKEIFDRNQLAKGFMKLHCVA